MINEAKSSRQEDFEPEKAKEGGQDEDNKQEGFFTKAKSVLSNKEVLKQFGKTVLGSVASIAGVKSFYDVPAYLKQKFDVFKDKKEYKDIFADLGFDGLENDAEMSEKKVAEIIDLKQLDAIEDKIENMDASEDVKNKLMEKLNSLVENYHSEMESLRKKENEKLTATLDEYLKTKISGMQATKEALNTLFVAGGAYGLRGLSYGALSVFDRHQRLLEKASKEGKDVGFMKDVILGGVKETYNDLVFKGDGTKMEKALRAVKSFGSLARLVGISETAINSPDAYGKAVDKILDFLDGDSNWSDVGQNFLQNIENRIPFVGNVSEAEARTSDSNAYKATVTKILKEKYKIPGLSDYDLGADDVIEDDSHLNKDDMVRDALQKKFHVDYNDSAHKKNPFLNGVLSKEGFSPITEQEDLGDQAELLQLATIQRGQGVEHVFIRQLRDDPKKFGYKGDLRDMEKIKKWAGKMAHRIAIDNGYVKKGGKHHEVWMKASAIGKAAYVLEKGDDENIVVHEYFKQPNNTFKSIEVHKNGQVFEANDSQNQLESYEYKHDQYKKLEKDGDNQGEARLKEKIKIIRQKVADREELQNALNEQGVTNVANGRAVTDDSERIIVDIGGASDVDINQKLDKFIDTWKDHYQNPGNGFEFVQEIQGLDVENKFKLQEMFLGDERVNSSYARSISDNIVKGMSNKFDIAVEAGGDHFTIIYNKKNKWGISKLLFGDDFEIIFDRKGRTFQVEGILDESRTRHKLSDLPRILKKINDLIG